MWLRHQKSCLEGDGIVIVSSINLLCDSAIGAVCTDDYIDLQLLGLAHLAAAILVVIVVQGEWPVLPILQVQ